MKILMSGAIPVTKLSKAIKECVNVVREKTGVKKYPFIIDGAEIHIGFKVKDSIQGMGVNHDGIDEIFTVAVQVDEEGNIINSASNEDKSFLDDYTRAQLKGEKKEYAVMKSAYDKEELDLKHTTDGGDIQELVSIHKDTGATVVQYIKNDELVGEMTIPKGDVKHWDTVKDTIKETE